MFKGFADENGGAVLVVIPMDALKAAGAGAGKFVAAEIINKRYCALGIFTLGADEIGSKNAEAGGVGLGEKGIEVGHALKDVEVGVVAEYGLNGLVHHAGIKPAGVGNDNLTHLDLGVVLALGEGEDFGVEDAHSPGFVVETERIVVVAFGIAVDVNAGNQTGGLVGPHVELRGDAYTVRKQRGPAGAPINPAGEGVDVVVAGLFAGIGLHLGEGFEKKILAEAVFIDNFGRAYCGVKIPAGEVVEADLGSGDLGIS